MAGVATLGQQHRQVGLPARSRGHGREAVAAGVLQRVAGVVGSSLSVEGALEAVARATIEGIPAARCNTFAVQGDALVPVATVSASAAAGSAVARVGVAPVPLGAPVALRLFARARAVEAADLSRSSFRCLDAGGRGSLLAAPLLADGAPVGALALVWDDPGRAIAAHQRDLFDAVAALASVAVRLAAGRAEAGAGQAVDHTALVAEAAKALGRASSPEAVAAALHEALGRLWPGLSCRVVVRADGDGDARVSPVSPPGGPADASGAAGRCVTSLPLESDAGGFGTIVVEWVPPAAVPQRAELDLARTLAALAADALDRLRSAERLRLRAHEAEVLARLSHVVAGSGGLGDAVRELNRTLPAEFGMKLRSIAVANAKLRAAVGGGTPDALELEAVRSWRAVLAKGGPLRCRPVPGGVLVPVAHRSKVHGALRVVGGPAPVEGGVEELLVAVGAACAELVHRAALREHLAESERRLAVASERDRIAQDLHDSVGQLLVAMGMRLGQYLADAPDKVWRARLEELLQMAGRGNREVRQSVYALLFLEARGVGLASSIRELCSRFEITTGLPVRFQQRGTPVPLAAPREDALFRTAHEAMVNAERHARASMLTVQLVYGHDAVSLTVRDDGVGLGHRDPFGRSGHFGIRTMQRRVEEAGGDLRVRNAAPRGVVVEAVIPRRKGAATRAGSRGRRG